MPSAEELINAFAQQESAETQETLATLVEFIEESGLVENAISALCEWIDDEELAEELATFVQQKGVSVDDS